MRRESSSREKIRSVHVLRYIPKHSQESSTGVLENTRGFHRRCTFPMHPVVYDAYMCIRAEKLCSSAYSNFLKLAKGKIDTFRGYQGYV